MILIQTARILMLFDCHLIDENLSLQWHSFLLVMWQRDHHRPTVLSTGLCQLPVHLSDISYTLVWRLKVCKILKIDITSVRGCMCISALSTYNKLCSLVSALLVLKRLEQMPHLKVVFHSLGWVQVFKCRNLFMNMTSINCPKLKRGIATRQAFLKQVKYACSACYSVPIALRCNIFWCSLPKYLKQQTSFQKQD